MCQALRRALRHSLPASSLKIPFSIHGETEVHWVEALFSKQKYLLSPLDAFHENLTASFLQDTLPHQHPQPRHEHGQHPHLTSSSSPSNYWNIPCLGYFMVSRWRSRDRHLMVPMGHPKPSPPPRSGPGYLVPPITSLSLSLPLA